MLTFIYLICLCMLVLVAKAPSMKRYYALMKGICSSIFVIQIIIELSHQKSILLLLILAFGVCCALGDILLGFVHVKSFGHRKMFLSGVLCFALAHLFLATVLFLKTEIGWQTIILPICSLLLVRYIEKQPDFQFGKMRSFVIGYSIMVTIVLAQCMILSVNNGNWLPALGALLFWISDFMLVFLYFHVRPWKYLRVWNLIFYYLGIEILIVSLLKIFI